MPKVFISYARDGGSGEKLAAEVQVQLQQQNMEVFRDVIGLKPGESFPHRLEFELESSDMMVLVVSEKVRKSEWVYNEYSLAKELGLPIVPLLAEAMRLPLWLRNVQVMNFCDETNWTGMFDALDLKIPPVPPFSKGGTFRSSEEGIDRMASSFEKGGTRGISTPQLETSTDQYGKYTDLNIKGVIQRFRWIEPGTFMMGSPKNEPEREYCEVQREVTISTGFWMADTTVTQSLWQFVMNNNHSHFKGEQLPVETVSWDDCQPFIEQLNRCFSDLTIGLPTEAEWEYACRAGTQTPFSFGLNVTSEQVNYNGNYPYHNGAKGEFRDRAVEVKNLPTNRWGLYGMHGNVFEWCQDDWVEEVPVSPVLDPFNVSGSGQRVVRGGSWYLNGKFCRSAYRLGHSSTGCRSNLGFRLVFRSSR